MITPATKIRTNPYSRFGPATADRGSRGIRDQPRNPPKSTEKRIRINFPFPCPSRGQLPPVGLSITHIFSGALPLVNLGQFCDLANPHQDSFGNGAHDLTPCCLGPSSGFGG